MILWAGAWLCVPGQQRSAVFQHPAAVLQISSLQLCDPVLTVRAKLAMHSPWGTASSCALGSWAEMLLVTEFLLLQRLGEVLRTPCCPNRSVASDELSQHTSLVRAVLCSSCLPPEAAWREASCRTRSSQRGRAAVKSQGQASSSQTVPSVWSGCVGASPGGNQNSAASTLPQQRATGGLVLCPVASGLLLAPRLDVDAPRCAQRRWAHRQLPSSCKHCSDTRAVIWGTISARRCGRKKLQAAFCHCLRVCACFPGRQSIPLRILQRAQLQHQLRL